MTSSQVRTSPWLKAQPTASRRPQLRVIAFPPAGGGAASFAALGEAAGPWVECHTVEMPGRASRIADPPAPSIEVAVAEITDAIVAGIAPGRLPYVLLGQCMGGLVAYEVAARLDDLGVRAPMCVIVAGSNGPSVPLPDIDDPLAFLRRAGGAPEEVFAAPDFLEMTLAVLRADLSIVERYRAVGRVIRPPLTVLSGADDTMVDPIGLKAWEGHSVAGVTFEQLPGGHFFLDQHYGRLLSRLRRELNQGR